MNNIPINFYPEVKFLGLYFDNHLYWKAHIRHIKAKALKALNLVKILAHTSWGADRNTLLKLYKTTVLPILEYGSPIFSSASESTLRMLDPVHNLGIRLASGAFRSSPVQSLIVEAGELPLSYKFKITICRALKIITSPTKTKDLFKNTDCFLNTNIIPSFPSRAKRLFNYYNMNDIRFFSFDKMIPPWIINSPQICTKLSTIPVNKNNNPIAMKQFALEHIKLHNHNHLYTDGSKDENGVGLAVYGNNIKIQSSLSNIASVFTAELLAIKSALKIVMKNHLKEITIFSDSLSSINAIKSYSNKSNIVKEIKFILHEMKLKNISVTLCWIPSHIGLEGNEKADIYAKEAKTFPISSELLPVEDYIRFSKSVIKDKWQNCWRENFDNNKLREIKDTVDPWPSSFQKDRRCSVILTRLRIGHTRLTHGYLMSNPHNPIPMCNICNVQITVKHIIMICPKYSTQRNLLFRGKSFKDILSESDKFLFSNILKFLRFYDLLDQI